MVRPRPSRQQPVPDADIIINSTIRPTIYNRAPSKSTSENQAREICHGHPNSHECHRELIPTVDASSSTSTIDSDSSPNTIPTPSNPTNTTTSKIQMATKFSTIMPSQHDISNSSTSGGGKGGSDIRSSMSQSPQQPFVVSLASVRAEDVGMVGGKNASLGEMIAHLTSAQGIAVPGGFCTTTAAYHAFMSQNDLGTRVAMELGGLDTSNVADLSRRGARVRALMRAQPLPKALTTAVLAAYDAMQYEEARSSCAAGLPARYNPMTTTLSLRQHTSSSPSLTNIGSRRSLLSACDLSSLSSVLLASPSLPGRLNTTVASLQGGTNRDDYNKYDGDARKGMLTAAMDADAHESAPEPVLSLAVRSSATAEDLPDASFAGQQETFLNVSGCDQLLAAVHAVFVSLYTDRAISYRALHGYISAKVSISAGVQRMVRSDLACAGVAFTCDTETGHPGFVLVNAAWGLGETLVGGSVIPDEFLLAKASIHQHKPSVVARRRLGTKDKRLVFGCNSTGKNKSAGTGTGGGGGGGGGGGSHDSGGGSNDPDDITMLSGTTAMQQVPESEQHSFCLTEAELASLGRMCLAIESHFARHMDIEWAKDGLNGRIYIVQARPETVHAQKTTHYKKQKTTQKQAQAQRQQRQQLTGGSSKSAFEICSGGGGGGGGGGYSLNATRTGSTGCLESIAAAAGERVLAPGVKTTSARVLTSGIAVGRGVSVGQVRIVARPEDMLRVQPGDVLVSVRTDPDLEPVMRIASAVVTDGGGRTCHAAIVAREIGVPAVVGTSNATKVLIDGQTVTVVCTEGSDGQVFEGALDTVVKMQEDIAEEEEEEEEEEELQVQDEREGEGEGEESFESFVEEKYGKEMKPGVSTRQPLPIQGSTIAASSGATPDFSGISTATALSAAAARGLPSVLPRMCVNLGLPSTALAISRGPAQGVGLARLEFVIARDIGIHPNACLHPAKLTPKEQAEVQRRARGYDSPAHFYTQRLAEGLATIAMAFEPRPVIARFSDFKSSEYRALVGGASFEPSERNPMIGWRGASRYTDARFRAAFALECAAVRHVREKMGLHNLEVMIPFVRSEQELIGVLDEMARNGLRRGVHGLRVIMMCELPCNAIKPEAFLRHVDGFSIGSNDLTQLTLGVDRDAGPPLSLTFNERDPAVKELMRSAIAACRKHKKYVGICGEGPSDHPKLAHWLADQGIAALSLAPDALIKTWKRLGRKTPRSRL